MRKIIVLLGLILLIVSNSFSQSTPYLDLVKKLLSNKDITFNQLLILWRQKIIMLVPNP